MRDPSVEALLAKPFEVRADHVQLRFRTLFIGHDALEVAAVIVTHLVALPKELSVKARLLRRWTESGGSYEKLAAFQCGGERTQARGSTSKPPSAPRSCPLAVLSSSLQHSVPHLP